MSALCRRTGGDDVPSQHSHGSCRRFNAREIPANCESRKWGAGQGLVTGDIVRIAPTYMFQPAYFRMISKVSAEVKLIHLWVKEGKRMAGGRIDSDEKEQYLDARVGWRPRFP